MNIHFSPCDVVKRISVKLEETTVGLILLQVLLIAWIVERPPEQVIFVAGSVCTENDVKAILESLFFSNYVQRDKDDFYPI